HARLSGAGHGRALHPCRRARGAAAQLRHLSASDGHPSRSDRVEVRAAQLVDLYGDPDRTAVWHPSGGRCRRRDGVPMARDRGVCIRGHSALRLRCGDGVHRLRGSGIWHRQSGRRYFARAARSARNPRMKTALDITRKLLQDPSAAIGLLIIAMLVAAAALAPLLATHPEAVWDMNPRHRLLPPSETYFFGTDRMGADIYSRILFGARITLTIATVAVGSALLIGVPIGLVSGWHHNWFGE